MAEFTKQQYSVEFLGDSPVAVTTIVEGLEWLGLVRLAMIKPAFEVRREGFFVYAQTAVTRVVEWKKAGDDALTIQITAEGQDGEAVLALQQTLENVSDLVNMDTNPSAAIDVIYNR